MAKNTTVGIDLGSYAIKVVELLKFGSKYGLLNYGVSATPGGLLSDVAIEQQALSNTIKKLIADSKISNKEVSVALPESQVYTFVIETPALSEKELSSSIQWEAEQYIPVSLSDVVLDWKILYQGKNQTEKNVVLLVAATKKIIDKYQKILDKAGLVPKTLETEIISATRSLSLSVPTLKTIMVVNMGASTTDFSILSNNILLFSRSIGVGGLAFTKSIKQELQIEEGQAEEYKKAYGLDESKLEGKVFQALKPVVGTIIEELKKGVAFFKEKSPERRIDSIILSGGASLTPSLVSYFAKELEIETQIGNPFATVEIDANKFKNFNPAESTIYSVAVGLAMRENI